MTTHRLKRFSTPLAVLAVSTALTFSAPGAADPETAEPVLTVGEVFPRWELGDQFDATHRLPGDDTEAIVFSRSQRADGALSPALEAVAGDRLITGEVAYLSDISRMPGLIARLIALPSLRERGYPVVLIREQGVSAALVTRQDCLVRYGLERGRVVSRDDLCEEADVKAAF